MEENYWEMDMGEARRWLKAANIRTRDSLKMQAINSYNHVHLMTYAIARALGEKVEMPPLHELYPDLFGEEIRKAAEERRIREQNERSINNFKAFAAHWNARFEENLNE